jgi:hypothetical protein
MEGRVIREAVISQSVDHRVGRDARLEGLLPSFLSIGFRLFARIKRPKFVKTNKIILGRGGIKGGEGVNFF